MKNNKHTIDELHQWQALPLSIKERMSMQRIRDWVDYYGIDGVYLAYSGGMGSTVLSHLIDRVFPNNDIPRVFCDTGLEYPEIREFVKRETRAVFIRPKLTFRQVIQKYGYPIISKEVSECVYGARKYLTSLVNETADLNERTNERTNERIPYKYFYEKLTGQGKYSVSRKTSADNARKNESAQGRFKSEVSPNVRMANEGTDDKGEYP